MKNVPTRATAKGMPAIETIGKEEQAAWQRLDDAVSKARRFSDVTFHIAGQAQKHNGAALFTRISRSELESLCTMVFETDELIGEALELATAFYNVGIAPREAA